MFSANVRSLTNRLVTILAHFFDQKCAWPENSHMDSLMILETLSTKGLDSTKSWQSKTSQWPLPKPMPSFFYSINFDPIFTCPHILRLGGAGDGPKWTCDPHRLQRVAKERRALATNVLNTTKLTKISILKEDQPQPQAQTNCLIYSVGCAGIYKWEEALARSLMEPGQQRQNLCEIHVFDFTKDYTVQGHVENFKIHFHPWGLKSTYDNTLDSSVLKPPDTAIMLTLPDMMKRVGHTDHVIDIFKVDCEFCGALASGRFLALSLSC